MKKKFEKTGYHIERAVFSEEECNDFLTSLHLEEHRSPPIWGKGGATVFPTWASIARSDKIADRVSELIGDDVILWGASLIERIPKQVHHWHNDLESFKENSFVSVWMGLTKTDLETSLKVIPGSHLISKPIRQFAEEDGIGFEEIQDKQAIEWSKTVLLDSHSSLVF